MTTPDENPSIEIPIPPLELRELVGPTDPAEFDNPSGGLIFPELPESAYAFVLDFGCGCGRVARRLLQQRPRPDRYVGVDLHRGMIHWCREHLAPIDPSFEFVHQDISNRGFNPAGKLQAAPFPVDDGQATLVIAWSVFTHVLESSAEFYLSEVSRVLARPGGVALTTWFLFDKTEFPMMQEFQNALYINDQDPTNAVIYDRSWLLGAASRHGLRISRATPPAIRGFQWVLRLEPASDGRDHVDLPEDLAPLGHARPPLTRPDADSLGLGAS